MCDIRMCFLFGRTGPRAQSIFFSVSGEDQTLYDLSGFDIVYEPGDDVSGPDYPADD